MSAHFKLSRYVSLVDNWYSPLFSLCCSVCVFHAIFSRLFLCQIHDSSSSRLSNSVAFQQANGEEDRECSEKWQKNIFFRKAQKVIFLRKFCFLKAFFKKRLAFIAFSRTGHIEEGFLSQHFLRIQIQNIIFIPWVKVKKGRLQKPRLFSRPQKILDTCEWITFMKKIGACFFVTLIQFVIWPSS